MSKTTFQPGEKKKAVMEAFKKYGPEATYDNTISWIERTFGFSVSSPVFYKARQEYRAGLSLPPSVAPSNGKRPIPAQTESAPKTTPAQSISNGDLMGLVDHAHALIRGLGKDDAKRLIDLFEAAK